MAVAALHLVFDARDHVVAQIIEAELVVRAVGDVAVVLLPLLLGQRVVGDDRADAESEKAVDLAHPLRVAGREIVVDGHEVYTAPREPVEVRRQRRLEALALAGVEDLLHHANTATTSGPLSTVLVRSSSGPPDLRLAAMRSASLTVPVRAQGALRLRRPAARGPHTSPPPCGCAVAV